MFVIHSCTFSRYYSYTGGFWAGQIYIPNMLLHSVHEEMKTSLHSTTDVCIHFCEPISLPPSLSLLLKPYFNIRVKLIFEAFHTYMLIWPHTFVAQQHASLCARTHCGLIRASQPHLLASLITLQQQAALCVLSAHFFPPFLDKSRLDTPPPSFFFFFLL